MKKSLRRMLSSLLIIVMMLSSISFGEPIVQNEEIPIDVSGYSFKGDVSPESKLSEDLMNLDADVTEVRVIIEFQKAPIIESATAMGVKVTDMSSTSVMSMAEAIKTEQDEAIKELTTKSDLFTVHQSFDTVFNGISATVNVSDLEKIADMPNVKSVSIANVYARPETMPDMDSSYMLTKSKFANEELGYKGEGLVVAIIDTGIDWTHKDFMPDPTMNNELTQATVNSIVASEELPGQFFTDKVPYGYNYMDNDYEIRDLYPGASMHGMHVAGTVAADGEISGVAPKAQVLAMKVFGNDPEFPSTYGDTIIAAIDDSIALGADVMNLSLGSTAAWVDENDPEQQAITRATNNGIVMAISAGNSAFMGNGNANQPYNFPLASNPDVGVVGSPGLVAESIQVASVGNYAELYVHDFTYEGLEAPVQGFGADLWTPGTYEVVAIGGEHLGYPEDYDDLDVTGKVVLVSRGDLPFVDKTETAAEMGAIGIIVYDHGLSQFYYNQGGWTIPFMKIHNQEGLDMEALLETDESIQITVSLNEAYADPNAGQVSSFSSWGTTPDMSFKPDIAAPGEVIYSTLNNNEYGLKQGTSMAAPHVAGGSALVIERIEEDPIFSRLNLTEQNKVDFAKNVLMNTAVPVKEEWGYASVRHQGAGSMNLQAALTTPAVVKDMSTNLAKVNLKEIKQGRTASFTLNIKNYSDETVAYDFDFAAQINDAAIGYNLLSTDFIGGYGIEVLVNKSPLTGPIVLGPRKGANVKVILDFTEAYNYNGDSIFELFENGNFVEAFVWFRPSEKLVDASVANYDAAVATLDENLLLIETLTNEIAELELLIAEKQEAMAAKQAEIDAKQGQIDEAQAAVDAYIAEHAAEVADVELLLAQLAEAEQNLADAVAAYDEIREALLTNAQAYSVADLFQGNFEFIESLYDFLDDMKDGPVWAKRMSNEARRELKVKINEVIAILNDYETVVNNLVVSEDFLNMTQEERNALFADLKVKVKDLNADLDWMANFLASYDLDGYLTWLRDAALVWANTNITAIQEAIDALEEGADATLLEEQLAFFKQIKTLIKEEITKVKTLRTLEANVREGITLNDNILAGIKEIKERAQIVDNAVASKALIEASVQEQDMTTYDAYLAELAVLEDAVDALEAEKAALQGEFDTLEAEKLQAESDKADKEAELIAAQALTEGLETAKAEAKALVSEVALMRDRAVELSVPVMGFLGDFDDAPAFDAPRYDANSYYNVHGYVTNYTSQGEEGLYYMFETSAISPNGDGYQDILIPYMTALRNVEDVKAQVTDESGNVLKTLAMREAVRKHYVDYDGPTATLMEDGTFYGDVAFEMLPEGHYNLRYEGTISTGAVHTQDIPFMIDVTPPSVGLHGYSYKDKIFSIASEDNLSGVDTYVVLAPVFDEEFKLVDLAYVDSNTTGIFDFSAMEEPPLYVTYAVIDKASNEALYTNLIPLVEGDVPEFFNISPEAFSIIETRDVTFTADVYDEYLKDVTVNGELMDLVSNEDGSYAIEKEISYETDGKKGIEVVGEDIFGNRTMFTRWFYIDSQMPELDVRLNDVSLSKEDMNFIPYGSDSIDVKVNASDNFPYLQVKVMDSVEYLFEADFFSYEDEIKPHETTLDETIDLEPGLNLWAVEVEDAYGHVVFEVYSIYLLDDGMTEPTLDSVEIIAPDSIERGPERVKNVFDYTLYDRFDFDITSYVTVTQEEWAEDSTQTWFNSQKQFVIKEAAEVPFDVNIDLTINGVVGSKTIEIVDPDRVAVELNIAGQADVEHSVEGTTTVQISKQAFDQFGDLISVNPEWSVAAVDMVPGTETPAVTIDENGLLTIDKHNLEYSGDFEVTATLGDLVANHVIHVDVLPFFNSVIVTQPTGFVYNVASHAFEDELARNASLTHDFAYGPKDQYGNPFVGEFTLISDDENITIDGYEMTIPSSYEGTFTLSLEGETWVPTWTYDISRPAATPARPTGGNVQVIRVNLNETDLELEVGTEAEVTDFQLEASVSGTTNDAIVWSSSDQDVATVDDNGLVTAVGVGTAVITASREIGTQSDSCNVEVFLIGEEDNPLGAVTFNEPYMSGFEDGTFRANSALTRGQLAVIYTKILGLNTEFLGEQKFTDVNADDWSYQYVQAVARTGIFSGYSDGTFKPDQELSRGELAATFSKYWEYKQIDVATDAVENVLDVSSHWAKDHIFRLYNAKVVDDEAFQPDAPALRGQVVVMMNTLIDREPMDVGTSKFSDVTDQDIMGAIEAATSRTVDLNE